MDLHIWYNQTFSRSNLLEYLGSDQANQSSDKKQFFFLHMWDIKPQDKISLECAELNKIWMVQRKALAWKSLMNKDFETYRTTYRINSWLKFDGLVWEQYSRLHSILSPHQDDFAQRVGEVEFAKSKPAKNLQGEKIPWQNPGRASGSPTSMWRTTTQLDAKC